MRGSPGARPGPHRRAGPGSTCGTAPMSSSDSRARTSTSPCVLRSRTIRPGTRLLSGLLVRMANDALNEFAYPAAIAGQSHSLYRHRRGVSVRLSGWSDKQDLLLARIVRTLRALPLPARRFEAEKAEYARELRNVDERRPVPPRDGPGVRDAAGSRLVRRCPARGAGDGGSSRICASTRSDSSSAGRLSPSRTGTSPPGEAKVLGGVLERELLGSMRPTRVGKGRVVRLAPGARYGPLARERARGPCARRLPPGPRARLLRAGDDGAARPGDGKPVLPRAQDRARDRIHRLRHPAADARSAGSRAGDPIPVGAARGASPGRWAAFIRRSGAVFRDMPSAVFERHRTVVENALLEPETRLDERTERYLGRYRPRALRIRSSGAAPRSVARRHAGGARGQPGTISSSTRRRLRGWRSPSPPANLPPPIGRFRG